MSSILSALVPLLPLVLTLAPQSAERAPGDAPSAVEQLRSDAAAMQPLVSSPLAAQFLAAVPCLPALGAPRIVFYDKAKGHALTPEQAASMSPEQLAGHEQTALDESFYYTTRYGTPVAFVRPLEILGQAGVKTVEGWKLLDFGFGSIGQLRALASAGADAVGVEVDPLLEALYSQPGDTGRIARCAAAGAAAGEGRDGSVSLVFGRFPADASIVQQVGGGYDAFISKNTLKRGYIHPERPVDPRRLVQLGVDDETFVRALFELLKPGGFALIYNLCPAPAKDDEPYIPWADGRSPFARELYERVGFVVSAFDQDDTPAARAMGAALGWAEQMDLESDLFGTYTLLRKPEATARTPAAAPESADVAFERAHGLIHVELAWGEKAPLLALVDTGASASAIDERVSAELPSARRTEITGTTGTVGADLVTLADLRLGDLRLPELAATRRDLSGLLPLGARPIDMILGSDAFAGLALSIDFDAGRLVLSRPAARTTSPPPDDSVPMTLDNGIPVIPASIDGFELPLRIDTGASLFDSPDVYVNVPTRTWRSLLERTPALAPVTHFAGTGAGGATVELPVVPVRRVRIGPLELETAFIVVQPEVGYFAEPDARGFVGNNALEKLGRVTLDYAAGRLWASRVQAAGDSRR